MEIMLKLKPNEILKKKLCNRSIIKALECTRLYAVGRSKDGFGGVTDNMAAPMNKVDKFVSIGLGKGRGYVTVLREHYLRDDIQCCNPGCPVCGTTSSSGQSCTQDIRDY